MATRWIFGYGSLIFRPAFEHVQGVAGFVRGYQRRFWQGSPDHRGTVERPGRVATVIPAPQQEICWGMAYEVPTPSWDRVFAALNAREIAGYREVEVDVYRPGSWRPVVSAALMYIALPENPNYLGPALLPEMARHINGSHGPSGSNADYLRQLAGALRELGAHDPHVFALEQALNCSQLECDAKSGPKA